LALPAFASPALPLPLPVLPSVAAALPSALPSALPLADPDSSRARSALKLLPEPAWLPLPEPALKLANRLPSPPSDLPHAARPNRPDTPSRPETISTPGITTRRVILAVYNTEKTAGDDPHESSPA
jgi:hypothetical protein